MATTDPQIVNKRSDGIDAYGLYVDYIVYSAGSGRLIQQERYFLVDNLLCKYVRTRGNKRAAWRSFPLPTHDEGRALLRKNVNRYLVSASYGIEMVYKPLLVELTSTDMDAVKKNEAPGARFDGTRVSEKMAGKIDDETWSPK
jgi:hypothetical protein